MLLFGQYEDFPFGSAYGHITTCDGQICLRSITDLIEAFSSYRETEYYDQGRHYGVAIYVTDWNPKRILDFDGWKPIRATFYNDERYKHSLLIVEGEAEIFDQINVNDVMDRKPIKIVYRLCPSLLRCAICDFLRKYYDVVRKDSTSVIDDNGVHWTIDGNAITDDGAKIWWEGAMYVLDKEQLPRLHGVAVPKRSLEERENDNTV